MQGVLVIGATGDQGAAQVDVLRAAGWPVVAAVRQPGDPRISPGVDSVPLDLHAPETLAPALAGVDTVFLNLPSASFNDPEWILQGFENFLKAAEKAAISRIVFNASLYVGPSETGHVAHDTRLRIIERLFASSVDATAVCPVIFMDNLLRGWALPSLRDRQVLSYPHNPDLPVSWICLSDVARIMLAVATDPAAVNRRLVVGGPEALRGEQTAAALGRAWGRPIRFESLPVAQFARQMGQLFAPDDPATAARIERDLAAVYRWYNESVPSPFTVDMREFLSRYSLELQTVETWAKAHPLSQEYIPTGGARHPQSAGQAS
ncbi:SDR family oxidoreductase [Haliea atlantica]